MTAAVTADLFVKAPRLPWNCSRATLPGCSIMSAGPMLSLRVVRWGGALLKRLPDGIRPAPLRCLIDTTAWYGEDAPKVWRERAAAAQSKGLAGLADFQVKRWFSDAFLTAHPEVVKATMSVFLANDLDCYAASCVLLGDADLRPFLPALRVPVTIVVGEEDYATPLAMAQQLHEAIRGSRLTILPKARHLTPIECPDQIASQLLSCLSHR